MPDVSIVIPCRNAERWLGETLASVFVQDVALDVVVVDDGSTDGSVAVAEQAPGPVRIIRQDARGASEARNAGTAAANGGYLQYLDADDVLEPGTLKARLAALDVSGADVALAAWARWERQPSDEFRIGDVVRRGYYSGGLRPPVAASRARSSSSRSRMRASRPRAVGV